MKKNNKIEEMTDQEWADAAAWLSGEDTADKDAARLLIKEEADIMKQWNDMKVTGPKQGNIDIDKAWTNVNRRIEAEDNQGIVRRMTFVRPLMRVAAAAVVVLGIGWFFYIYTRTEKVTVTSALDQKNIEVLLPDGSKVYLNRDSYLTYPETFGRNNRKVVLKGEAFFDITPDASRPFTIDAGNARVKVLGTSFNVITDNGHNEVEVYVSTGTVLLTSNDGAHSLTLEPGYIGTVSAGNESRALNTNGNYLSWNTGTLNYDGEKLEVVFRDLKRAYNIDITTSDQAIRDYRLTTLFENQPHDTIIQVICTTFNLHSVKEGETYTLSRR